MPTLRTKPVTLEAHRLRYGDIQGVSQDLPDWVEDAVQSGTLTMQPEEGSARLQVPGAAGYAVVRSGCWLALHPTGALRLLTDSEIAADYEVVT